MCRWLQDTLVTIPPTRISGRLVNLKFMSQVSLFLAFFLSSMSSHGLHLLWSKCVDQGEAPDFRPVL